jgi:hypothetical protein
MVEDKFFERLDSALKLRTLSFPLTLSYNFKKRIQIDLIWIPALVVGIATKKSALMARCQVQMPLKLSFQAKCSEISSCEGLESLQQLAVNWEALGSSATTDGDIRAVGPPVAMLAASFFVKYFLSRRSNKEPSTLCR